MTKYDRVQTQDYLLLKYFLLNFLNGLIGVFALQVCRQNQLVESITTFQNVITLRILFNLRIFAVLNAHFIISEFFTTLFYLYK